MGTQLNSGTPKAQPTAVALQPPHAGDSTWNLDNLGQAQQLRARLVMQRPRDKVSLGVVTKGSSWWGRNLRGPLAAR